MYLAGCAALGPICLSLSPIPVIPLLTYSLLKRFTSLCHFGIGLCLAMGPAGAYVATSGELPMQTEILLLTGFTFAWISGFDIIYALQDLEFDRTHSVHSIPAAIGSSGAQVVAALTHLAGAVALVLLWRSVGERMAAIALTVSLLATAAAYVQSIPTPVRFFPIAAIAGIAGALVVLLGGSS